MTLLYILGALGGTIYLVETLGDLGKKATHLYRKYKKMEVFYNKNHKDQDVKLPMGFRTDKEQSELEDRLAKKGA